MTREGDGQVACEYQQDWRLALGRARGRSQGSIRPKLVNKRNSPVSVTLQQF